MADETRLTKEYIDGILDEAEFHVSRQGEKTCVVVAKLRNGFEIVGSAACVDPENYSEEEGTRIAKQQIEEKLWELEGYRLQCAVTGEP